ncbi:MAG: CBS domain-containing protein [Candidatus Aenigmarchaeota archaeon]|nr:CBS domain-containing protein [Candidatus Aenigmarchaeota archaeon]
MLRSFFRKKLRVRDAMTTELAQVLPNTTIQSAAKKMEEFRVANVLVIDKGKLIGMVSERDITRKAVAKNKCSKTKVKDIMESPVKYVSPDEDLLHASDKMLMNKIRRLPVIDLEKKEVIGIITMKDIMSVLPTFLLDKIEWLRIHPGGEAKKRVKGICEVCGKFTNDLKFSRGLWICGDCE